jgi:hypothetical protein
MHSIGMNPATDCKTSGGPEPNTWYATSTSPQLA